MIYRGNTICRRCDISGQYRIICSKRTSDCNRNRSLRNGQWIAKNCNRDRILCTFCKLRSLYAQHGNPCIAIVFFHLSFHWNIINKCNVDLLGIRNRLALCQNQKFSAVLRYNDSGGLTFALIRIIKPVGVTLHTGYRHDKLVCFFSNRIQFILKFLKIGKFKFLHFIVWNIPSVMFRFRFIRLLLLWVSHFSIFLRSVVLRCPVFSLLPVVLCLLCILLFRRFLYIALTWLLRFRDIILRNRNNLLLLWVKPVWKLRLQ